MIKEGLWNISSKRELKNVLNDIYEIMNKFSTIDSYQQMIMLQTKGLGKKIFLNGDDPFDKKNWVAGEELVFNLQRDKVGMYKVKDCLIKYEELLKLAGALIIEEPSLQQSSQVTDKKGEFCSNLLVKLKRQCDKYHDVFFIFKREENKKIGASRYVLSGMFCILVFILYNSFPF